MRECKFCKKSIDDGFFRCDSCNVAYSHGFNEGMNSVRQEIAFTLKKWISGGE